MRVYACIQSTCGYKLEKTRMGAVVAYFSIVAFARGKPGNKRHVSYIIRFCSQDFSLYIFQYETGVITTRPKHYVAIYIFLIMQDEANVSVLIPSSIFREFLNSNTEIFLILT
jgi:hypothetical protein